MSKTLRAEERRTMRRGVYHLKQKNMIVGKEFLTYAKYLQSQRKGNLAYQTRACHLLLGWLTGRAYSEVEPRTRGPVPNIVHDMAVDIILDDLESSKYSDLSIPGFTEWLYL